MKTRKILVGAALVALFVRGGFAAPVVLEAESFDNLGGWTLDAQFMEQNHSRDFYAVLRSVCPDYDRWDAILNRKGKEL